jgi:hypothetical protein
MAEPHAVQVQGEFPVRPDLTATLRKVMCDVFVDRMSSLNWQSHEKVCEIMIWDASSGLN